MFSKPREGRPTRHLFIGSAGAAAGAPAAALQPLLAQFGACSLHEPDGRHHLFVSYDDADVAAAALAALDGRPCAAAGGRRLAVKYADLRRPAEAGEGEEQAVPVALSARDCGVPGLSLLLDFVTPEEEQALLDEVDGSAQWQRLARRRVAHYGFRFDYPTRNVDASQPGAPFPACLAPVLRRIQALPGVPPGLDQLTVNEYAPGVGLSAHVDTHSAFTGAIVSLSLAGPAVMEFRRAGARRALLLPRRSLLVMGGEARYAWQHYLPHRRADVVAGATQPRAARRVSLTLRKVRGFPCDCAWPEECDSQLSRLPPTRMAAAAAAADSTATAACSSQAGQHVDADRADACCAGGGAVGKSAAAMPPDTWLGGSTASPGPRHAAQAQPADCQSSVAGLGCVCGVSSRCSCSNQGAPAEPSMEVCSCSPQQQHALQQQRQHAAAQATGRPLTAPEASAAGRGGGEDEEARALRLEAAHVHAVYDAIAPHFSSTRFAIWPKVRQFLQALAPGSVVADVGCGNGKYFGVRRDLVVLASDRSAGLAATAAQRLGGPSALTRSPDAVARADVMVADALALPLRPGAADAALCIAVLHHISSLARRLRLLAELARILKPGGRGLVTVWASQQEDPRKLTKWQPLPAPAPTTAAPPEEQPSSSSGSESLGPCCAPLAAPEAALSASVCHQQAGAQSQQARQGGAEEEGGPASEPPSGDFFVPWHLPFHRLEAAAAVAGAQAQAQAHAQQNAASPPACAHPAAAAAAEGAGADPGPVPPPAPAAASHPAALTPVAPPGPGAAPERVPHSGTAVHASAGPAAAAGGGVRVDAGKGAVVFQRYCHLFTRAELAGLVAGTPGLRPVETFYDRSNWCCLFERIDAGSVNHVS